MRLLEKIFSIKNKRDYKVLTLLGIKFSYSKFKLQKIKKFNNDKPTIAFQLNKMDKGGLEEIVLQLASDEKIREKYNTVIISEFTNKGYLAKLARKKGIPVYSFFENRQRIRKLIKKLNIKIVHFHYNMSGVEEYKNQGIRTIYTIHNNYIWFNEKESLERSLQYQNIDKFIAVSNQVKEFFLKKFTIPSDKVDVIPNGIEYIEADEIKPVSKENFGFNDTDFVFANIATISPIKYQFSQIAALKILKNKYPNIKLLLVGNTMKEFDIYHRELLSFIKTCDLENDVKLKDYVPKTEIYSYLKTVDAFISTSLSEGFGLSTAEAMMFEKPLILTDVGGARDFIQNNDIGILIDNAIPDLCKINIAHLEKDLVEKKYYFENVDEIANAMENIYCNQLEWKQKAKIAKSKIKKNFSLNQFCTKYLSAYLDLSAEVCSADIEELLKREKFTFSFFAPFPAANRVSEGWMSRIAVIDNLFCNTKRIYFNPYVSFSDIRINKFSDIAYEIQINPKNALFSKVIDLLVKYSDISYCHTLHMAEYIVNHFDNRKFIVDIHGIVPEEEVMLGNPAVKDKYEKIEQIVLKKAFCCIMVTDAMRIHYEKKYPNIKVNNYIILPIVEKLNIDESVVEKIANPAIEIIYSGSLQVWQNIDSMLKIAAKIQNMAHFTFLSNEFLVLKKNAKKLGLKNAEFDCVSKERLKEIYSKINFGFVLRDSSPVNFVACPTKIYDYLSCGVIPIVRYENIGDFVALGYKYIKEEDLLNKKLPSKEEQKEMIYTNFEAAKKMRMLFEKGAKNLQEINNSTIRK